MKNAFFWTVNHSNKEITCSKHNRRKFLTVYQWIDNKNQEFLHLPETRKREKQKLLRYCIILQENWRVINAKLNIFLPQFFLRQILDSSINYWWKKIKIQGFNNLWFVKNPDSLYSICSSIVFSYFDSSKVLRKKQLFVFFVNFQVRISKLRLNNFSGNVIYYVKLDFFVSMKRRIELMRLTVVR